MSSNPTRDRSPVENRCPDCLFLKLEGTPIWKGLIGKNYSQIDLHLTLNFNEEELKLLGGSVWFGVRRGELKLKLVNGYIPYNSRNLNHPFTLAISKDIQTLDGREYQSHIGGSLSIKERGLKADATEKSTANRTESFQETTWRVSTKGLEEEPSWVFETNDLLLRGTLPKELLATMEVTMKPCRVEATFEVSKRDIRVTRGEGVWPDNISRNKRAWIENEIILWVLKEKLTTYLSRVELHYD